MINPIVRKEIWIILRDFGKLERMFSSLTPGESVVSLRDELSRISIKLMNLVRELDPHCLALMPSRNLFEAVKSGKIPGLKIRERSPDDAILIDNLAEWTAMAENIKEAREEDILDYYGFTTEELAEIKAELQRNGWHD